MTFTSTDHSNDLAARAAQSAERALRSTQTALDGLADSMHSLQNDAVGSAQQALSGAEKLAHQGARSLRESSQQVFDKAHDASRHARHYIERQPVNAMLIAAGAGAALTLVLTMMLRSNRHR